MLKWEDKKKLTNIIDITTIIRDLKWNWTGKPQGWNKQITERIPLDQKKSTATHRKRWRDDLKQELIQVGLRTSNPEKNEKYCVRP